MPGFENKKIAEILRNVAAAYTLKKGNRFQISAYENVADSIEHSPVEIEYLWKENKLNELPGIGPNIENHLDELLKTGRVKHFEKIMEKIPEATFSLLKLPGVGPKTAYKIAQTGIISITDLERKIKTGWLKEKGFSEKSCENLLRGIEELKRKSGRLLLYQAQETANSILNWLKDQKEVVERADSLGSLRRGLPTVGDIDLSVSSNQPETVIKKLIQTSQNEKANILNIAKVIESGPSSVSLFLKNGTQIDLMIQPPKRYGSLLQHFTGSKLHNIHLRRLANEKGLSLSEYGIKKIQETGDQFSQDMLFECATEKEFYQKLGLRYIPPELREDNGEIETAQQNKLPELIELKDIKGDLQTHTIWSDGVNTVKEIVEKAEKLGYEYLAITDHSYPNLDFEKRLKEIEQLKYSRGIKLLSGLEVNITADGQLQVPDKILEKHDYILAAIHTSFRQTKEEITARLIGAIANPHVKTIAHPTGRLLEEREGYNADWDQIFAACVKYKKALEINAWPNRLDLPDILVREAVKKGVKMVISTDAHEVSQMEYMNFGVIVARRGWAEKKDILNTLNWIDFRSWFGIKLS